MRTKLTALIILICTALSASLFAQQNPAVTNPTVTPSPAVVGSTATFSFNIGTAGLSIPGTGPTQRMGFTLGLSSGVVPTNVDGVSSVSGEILTYFDITYDAGTKTYTGLQKLNVAIPTSTLALISVAVTAVATPISANVNIQPNAIAQSQSQPTSDDNASIQTALPVTLTSFTATKEGSIAQLKWTTTAETNSDRFEIERSQNGKNWDLIGTQKSNGESTTLKNYTFSDAKPLNGENLYRLKMIDRDETFAYSRIQSLTFASDLATSFYPNPVAEKLIIKTDDFSLVKNVKIFDANGRTVYQSSATPSSEINVQNLSAGLYIVQMVSKSGAVISHKVIKQ
ncbi:hypothetical protein Dfri01_65020 [Dyadobacter frigoris]|uniref:T9SS type A sorting domain-containing protein n=1 Tax=Dyadobacter frigoris TaxID=2576211 RepID=UPI0024A052ED|nr:T9SS type A sorting domain-containing protein [Dyadobacter frigoris]GLU57041.1 hypothetical protein Dfri01_65020 [Dyadobacter frigoris]